MKNGALASHESLQGIYQISDLVNGQPSWTSNSHAIWYSLDSYSWLIGNLDGIGENYCYIYGHDNNNGGLDNNQWNYWDGSAWIPASANDIFINCTSKIFFQKL